MPARNKWSCAERSETFRHRLVAVVLERAASDKQRERGDLEAVGGGKYTPLHSLAEKFAQSLTARDYHLLFVFPRYKFPWCRALIRGLAGDQGGIPERRSACSRRKRREGKERLDEPVSRDYGLEGAFKGERGERTGDSRSFLLLSYDCYDFDLARSLSDRTVASFLCDLRYK